MREKPWLVQGKVGEAGHLATSSTGNVPRSTMDTSSQALRLRGRSLKTKKTGLVPMGGMRFLAKEVVETMVDEVGRREGVTDRLVTVWKQGDLNYQAIR